VSAVAGWQLVRTLRTLDDPTVHAIVHQRVVFELLRFVAAYAHVTYTIFLAVAVYRLLGFELPSGFRRPFLSRSFSEFFRSYNHYVRDAVLSLLYFPMLGHLRHHARPRLATIGAAYASIVIGSFLLHDLLVPLAIAVEPVGTFAFYLDPVRIASMLVLWTLIIVPNAGIAPRRRPPMSRTRIVVSVIVFNVLYFAIWLTQREGRGWFQAP
jgi:D-alanyl-lipoteichoic acid acyltransferase DltB (MBOAT superfamily)